jgi:hypothetical protein
MVLGFDPEGQVVCVFKKGATQDDFQKWIDIPEEHRGEKGTLVQVSLEKDEEDGLVVNAKIGSYPLSMYFDTSGTNPISLGSETVPDQFLRLTSVKRRDYNATTTQYTDVSLGVISPLSIEGSVAPFCLALVRSSGSDSSMVATTYGIPSPRIIIDFAKSKMYIKKMSADELASWSFSKVFLPCKIDGDHIMMRASRAEVLANAKPKYDGMELVSIGDMDSSKILNSLRSGGKDLLDCIVAIRNLLVSRTPMVIKDKKGNLISTALAPVKG